MQPSDWSPHSLLRSDSSCIFRIRMDNADGTCSLKEDSLDSAAHQLFLRWLFAAMGLLSVQTRAGFECMDVRVDSTNSWSVPFPQFSPAYMTATIENVPGGIAASRLSFHNLQINTSYSIDLVRLEFDLEVTLLHKCKIATT